MIGTNKKSIGEILLEDMNLVALTKEDLKKAEDIGRDRSKYIGDSLIQLGLISEDDLLRALSIQLDIPYLAEIDPQTVDSSIVSKVPLNFVRRNKLFPISIDGNILKVAMRDPLNLEPLDDLGILLGLPVEPVISSENEILESINRFYKQDADSAEKVIQDMDGEDLGVLSREIEEPDDLLEIDHDAPIIKLVNLMLLQAVKDRASDIHIEPFEKKLNVRYRIDGVLYNILTPPKRYQSPIVSRIKVMANLDIAEKRLPQDGRIKIKMTDREVDIRVSVLPTTFGERIVLRLLDKTGIFLDMKDIGFSKEDLERYEKLITHSNGIILVTGPTGSGKTTTLYATISSINSSEKNIITTEDPVEYQLDGIGQIQINPKIDLTFANSLRSILRQDPDVIMVGEIRDLETAEIAIHASLTGHLVFSTLHTNDSAGAVTRLLDMGIEPFLVSSSVLAIMAQRLVRVICPECKGPYMPDEKALKEIGLTMEDVRRVTDTLYIGRGCSRCLNTGYKGRTGIYELLTINDNVRKLIMSNADSSRIKRDAVKKNGMVTLTGDGARKVLQGMTTIEEILRVTQE
ncbi:MAG: type II secretion system ATPase GspE [Nitrospinota bacterium]